MISLTNETKEENPCPQSRQGGTIEGGDAHCALINLGKHSLPSIAPETSGDLRLTLIRIQAAVILATVGTVAALPSFLTFGRSNVFAQYRVGKDGKEFVLLKVKTMSGNRSNPNGEHAFRPDPKDLGIIGKLLQKSHLDELPQFLHLVGLERRFYQLRRWMRMLCGLGPQFGSVSVEGLAADLPASKLEQLEQAALRRRESEKIRSYRQKVFLFGKSGAPSLPEEQTHRTHHRFEQALSRFLSRQTVCRLTTPTTPTLKLVGNRPYPTTKAALVSREFPELSQFRHEDLPACTGLQQITLVARNDLEKMKQELLIEEWYRKHRSFLLDTAIVAATPIYMLSFGAVRPGRWILRYWPSKDRISLAE